MWLFFFPYCYPFPFKMYEFRELISLFQLLKVECNGLAGYSSVKEATGIRSWGNPHLNINNRAGLYGLVKALTCL